MTKTMNERFEEINKIISSHVDNNITRANVSCVANIKDGGRQLNQFIVVNKIINILEQEISLAKEEERKRIVERIEKLRLGVCDCTGANYECEHWGYTRAIDDIIYIIDARFKSVVTLITNNK